MNGLNMSLVIREKVVIQEKLQQKIIDDLDREVVRRLDDIKGMIDRAHVLLRHTNLVMKFDGETTSSPILPPAIQQESRALNVLMYLKPEKPDGLVMFLGEAQNTNTNRQKRQSQTKSDCLTDFIAVELKDRKPLLKTCTTAGGFVDVKARGERNEDFLLQTDGNLWYKVEVGL